MDLFSHNLLTAFEPIHILIAPMFTSVLGDSAPAEASSVPVSGDLSPSAAQQVKEVFSVSLEKSLPSFYSASPCIHKFAQLTCPSLWSNV
jgi:hypothetical protein